MIQLTDGMLLTHQKRRIRNRTYSLLEMSSKWDPQTKSGKLAEWVGLVTTSLVDNADMFIGKLLDWESKAVDAHTYFGINLPVGIKTAILTSMAPTKMRMKLFKGTCYVRMRI